MLFSSPSQFGQGSRSSSNTRLSSRARLNDWLSPDRPSANTRLWPSPGAPVDEFDATLLTFKPMS